MQPKSKTCLFKGPIVEQIQTKILYYLVVNNILDEDIVHVEPGFKTMAEFRFVELLNPKLFHAYEKNFLMEAFLTLDVYEEILDLNGL